VRTLKIGVIGDIHGNLEALTAVLEILEAEHVDDVVCVGDVVGYGADPVECIRIVRERTSVVVAGNHDYGAVGKQALDYFNSAAREAVLWTGKQLSDEDRRWLSNLPLVHRSKEYELVHASFYRPEAFEYIFNPEEATPSFTFQKSKLAFFGHTHWPSTFLDGEPVRHSIQKVVPIDPPGKVLINVGAVGQPRDSDPTASVVILDLGKGRVNFKRAQYDIQAAAKKIIDAGLPASLAERLCHGF
jgi:predicted phosphodiesterase